MLRNLFVLFMTITLGACVSESNTETRVTEAELTQQKYQRIRFADIKATAIEKDACLAAGGVVRPAGRLGAEHCIQNLSDAGKTCHDANDCLGRCVLERPDAHQIELGTKVAGVCEATDEHFGCTTLVKNGEVDGTLCVD